MIPKCAGCEEEFSFALDCQESGLHFATSLDQEVDFRQHFRVWMVDDDGKVIVE